MDVTADGADSFGVVQAVRFRACTAPQQPFLTFVGAHDPMALTNAEFAARVDTVADQLVKAGFRPGDACIVHTGNTVSFVILFVAITQLGGVVVPTIAMSTVDELSYVVAHSEACLLITTAELQEVALAAAQSTGCAVALDTAVATDTDNNNHTVLRLGDAQAHCPRGTGVLMYTSGSSGRPKGVLLSRESIDFTVLSYAEHLRLTSTDTVLICMPLFHVNGLMLQLLPAIVSGARIVLASKFSASDYWTWANNYHVTVGHLVSGPIRLLLQSDSDTMPTRMRAMTFALPLEDIEIADFEQRFQVPLLMVWGLTETCCGATLMGLDHRRRSEYQNVGQVLRGWSVKVIDKSGEPLPPGSHGELLVGSPGVMTGYHYDDNATNQALQDGYVATGDLGYFDEAGYVHFVSRIKDMLKPNGENVAASEVTDALSSHPDVREAAVFGVDDPIRIERVIASVVVKPGATVSVKDLREHCIELLVGFKVPSEIYLVDSIPKTSIGKQQVGELKSQYLANSVS